MQSSKVSFSSALQFVKQRTFAHDLTWSVARELIGPAIYGYSVRDAVRFTDGTVLAVATENGEGVVSIPVYFIVQ